MRHNEKGIVDTVIISETVDGNKLVKIKKEVQSEPPLYNYF